MTQAEIAAAADAPIPLPETAPARASFLARRRDVRRLRIGPRASSRTYPAGNAAVSGQNGEQAGRPGSPEGLKVDLPSVKVPAVAPIALPFQLPVRGRPSLGLEVFRGHKEIISA
ncbi:uncharacterized protein LOC116574844 isoform X1 [Mustela erminea]|uniref:uncharacterized protein LOC116574844 isoform X1 n=1 Tax=Mustela erminea TaxID=36723 RepID=UPI0013872394|nr:uncharacterized protein LOC116574844 isoform X1 [Mustela erminea]